MTLPRSQFPPASRSPFGADGAPVEWTIPDLISIFVRRRAWIFASLGAMCVLALVYWLCATPRYRATAVIEVQKQSHGAFGLDTTTTDSQATAISDSFDDNLTLQTEIGILQSDAIALEVIRNTGLESTPDYFAPHRGHLAWLHALFFWHKPLEPLTLPLTDAPNRRYAALKIFARRATIAPSAGTRLVAISYKDPDPRRAAIVVNALVQALADYSFQSRSSAASQSATWLQAQLAGLRQQTDALDAQAAELDRQAGAFGDDDAHNVILARLDELNASLSAAQSNRIVREAIWRAVESGDPEIISGLGGNSGAGVNTQNSFALLQSLRTQEAVAKSQIAESADRYGENWPALAEQRAGLQTIQHSIQDEVRRLGDRAHSDYAVAQQAENAARGAFNQQKDLASSLTGNAVAVRLARQQANESRTLYASLQTRLQQTGVLEGLHSGNFVVVTPAFVPPPDHPSSPSVPLLAAIALVGGFSMGFTAAIARELTDNTVRSAADLEALCDAPVLATIPGLEPARPWYRRLLPATVSANLALEAAASDFAIPAPPSPYVDALYRLRANLLLVPGGHAPRVITVTSATDAPGRSHRPAPDALYTEETAHSLALSLAAVLAQHGERVLCVDANLRSARPAGAQPVEPGLSDLLAGGQSLAFGHPSDPLLSVLPAGSRPPAPAELIASTRMSTLLARWREEFSFVILDSAPAIYADALILAQQSDAVLLTACAGRTRHEAIQSAHRALTRQMPEQAVLGLVLEDAPDGGSLASA